jgi:hypothetical protein
MTANALYHNYDDILRTIVGMINHPESWVLREQKSKIEEDTITYGDMF